MAIPGAEIQLEVTKNPDFPTAQQPTHRFEKKLGAAPWSGTAASIIDLDDPTWELLGYPDTLVVTIRAIEQ